MSISFHDISSDVIYSPVSSLSSYLARLITAIVPYSYFPAKKNDVGSGMNIYSDFIAQQHTNIAAMLRRHFPLIIAQESVRIEGGVAIDLSGIDDTRRAS